MSAQKLVESAVNKPVGKLRSTYYAYGNELATEIQNLKDFIAKRKLQDGVVGRDGSDQGNETRQPSEYHVHIRALIISRLRNRALLTQLKLFAATVYRLTEHTATL